MGSLKISKPLAVVDCNFIQRCSGDADDVPRSWDCLLIAAVFAELSIKLEHEREFLLGKFTAWMRRNANRLWIARDFIDLLETMERGPDRVKQIRLRHLVCPSRTRFVRSALRDGAVGDSRGAGLALPCRSRA